jgi:hypothetical protein
MSAEIHASRIANILLDLSEPEAERALADPRIDRRHPRASIGVIRLPQSEHLSHFFCPASAAA